MTKRELTKDEMLQMAADVVAGKRPRSDLDEHGITIGDPTVGDEAKRMLLEELDIDDSNPDAPPFVRAHAHSSRHRDALLRSTTSGCFYCLAIFAPSAIIEWIDEDQTALCPKCSIDSVIGSESGFPITNTFLREMHNHWF